MKRYWVLILCMTAYFQMFAQQSVSDIIKDCHLVYDTKDKFADIQEIMYRTTDGETEELPLYKLKWIYDLDVISYYRIQGYDTDLQKELYKETDEYKEYVKKLSTIRDSIKGSSFYYVHRLESNYDLNKLAFVYNIELFEGHYTEIPGYINHGRFCFEYATKRFPYNKIEISIRQSYVGDKYYNQKIYLPVKNKQTALKIEQAEKNKAVLFVFKIDSIKTVQHMFFKEELALARTDGIYIINTETGEVYCKVL